MEKEHDEKYGILLLAAVKEDLIGYHKMFKKILVDTREGGTCF